MRFSTVPVSISYLIFGLVVLLDALSSRKTFAASTSVNSRASNSVKSTPSQDREAIYIEKWKSAVYSALIRTASYILKSLPDRMKTRRRKSKTTRKKSGRDRKRPIPDDSSFEEFD